MLPSPGAPTTATIMRRAPSLHAAYWTAPGGRCCYRNHRHRGSAKCGKCGNMLPTLMHHTAYTVPRTRSPIHCSLYYDVHILFYTFSHCSTGSLFHTLGHILFHKLFYIDEKCCQTSKQPGYFVTTDVNVPINPNNSCN